MPNRNVCENPGLFSPTFYGKDRKERLNTYLQAQKLEDVKKAVMDAPQIEIPAE